MCVNTYFILMTMKVELCAILFLFIHPQLIAVSRNIRYIYCLFMVRVWKKIAPNIYIYALGNTVVKIIWSSKWQFCLYFKNFTLYILRRNLCCCVCLVTQSCLTPCTVAHQAPLPMKILQQEYWSGLPCPPPRDILNPRISRSPALKANSLLSELPGKPMLLNASYYISFPSESRNYL